MTFPPPSATYSELQAWHAKHAGAKPSALVQCQNCGKQHEPGAVPFCAGCIVEMRR